MGECKANAELSPYLVDEIVFGGDLFQDIVSVVFVGGGGCASQVECGVGNTVEVSHKDSAARN